MASMNEVTELQSARVLYRGKPVAALLIHVDGFLGVRQSFCFPVRTTGDLDGLIGLVNDLRPHVVEGPQRIKIEDIHQHVS